MTKNIYTEDYFNGKDSFFYCLGYGRFSKKYFDNLFKPIEPYIRKIKKGRVLDAGCAYGFMLERFPKSFQKFGVDVSEYAIAKALKKVPEGTFKVVSIEKDLPFSQNFFDIVIFNDVIEHLENPKKALENIRKSLKKGGFLYINTPNLNWLRKKVFAYADKKEHHISLLPKSDLRTLLKSVGFKIVDHWTFTTLPYFFFVKFSSNIGHESAFICKKM